MKPTVKTLHLIHRRLVARHRRKGDRGLAAVGIGWRMKDGKPNRERGLELVYLVKKIKKRPPKGHRIPDEIRVYLTKGKGRGRRKYLAKFSRHIMEMPHGVQLTGFQLNSGTEQFTGGAVVSWPGQNGPSWGLLTVSHGVVTGTVSVALPGGPAVDCQVCAQTQPGDALDAALLQLDAQVVQSRLASFLPPARPVPPIRTLDDLSKNWQTEPTECNLRTVSGPLAFNITHYFAGPTNPPIVPQEPNLQHILVGNGPTDTFDEGTSGSIWAAATGPVDAIQVAGYPNNDPPTLFSNGVAVSISDYLDWAGRQVGAAVKLVGAF